MVGILDRAVTQTEPNPTDPCPEDPEDALLEGDRTFTPGTAASALRHRTFRTVYFGAFASNIGTWMQNVVLGALAYELSGGSPLFVGLVMFAQLGPLLVLSMVGGMLADAVDRKKLLIVADRGAGRCSRASSPWSPWAATTRRSGCSSRSRSPSASATPCTHRRSAPSSRSSCPAEDMAGAISLNSAQMNGSRVIGPAIGSLPVRPVRRVVGVPAQRPQLRGHHRWCCCGSRCRSRSRAGTQGLHRLLEGVRYARQDKVVGRCLVIIFTFSLLSLPFITQLPTVADENLGIAPKSVAYGLLYGAFGWGRSSARCRSAPCSPARRRRSSPATACSRSRRSSRSSRCCATPAPAYPEIFGLGAVYFAVITSLSTVLQQDLDDSVRGKVMALWIMGFGGTVPDRRAARRPHQRERRHHLGDARRRRRRRGAGRLRPARAGAGGRHALATAD